MAKSKNKKTLRDDPTPIISRSYDIYSMEKRIYDLEVGGVTPPTPTGDIYSETETEIGTWVDGKKIYRKVIKPTLTSINANSNNTIADVSTFGIDTLIRARGCIKLSSTSAVTAVMNDTAWINTTGSLVIKPYVGHSNITSMYYVLEYTKSGS